MTNRGADCCVGKARPIRVMHFWGGVPQSQNSKCLQTIRIVEKCVERGWKCDVVLSEIPQSRSLVDPFLNAGAEILIHPRTPGSLNVGAIVEVYRFMCRHPPHLMHCHNRPAVPLVAAVLSRVPVRIWSRLAMSSIYEQGAATLWKKKVHVNIWASFFLAHEVLAISKSVSEELIKICKFKKEKIHILGRGVDFGIYQSGNSSRIKNEFCFKDEDFIFLTVGHAVPVKGWDILVKAFSKVCSKFSNAKLVLIGSNAMTNERETFSYVSGLAKELGISERVIFPGRREDIPDFFAACDIYIQPSRSEGLCSALVEALSAGMPCIAANVGGMPDLVIHDYNGFLFEREDIDGLARCMLILAEKQEVREGFSRVAAMSVDQLQLERVVEKTLEIYENLLIAKNILRF